MLVKLGLAVLCIGAGVKWIRNSYRGEELDGTRESSVIMTVFGIGAILLGLAILAIPFN